MKARDLSVLLGVILIIIMLVVPLPGWLLSVLNIMQYLISATSLS